MKYAVKYAGGLRTAFLIVAASAAFAVSACAKSAQPPGAKPEPGAARSANLKAPVAFNAETTKPSLTFLDPKTGKLQWKAQAQSIDAKSGAVSSNVVVTMQVVSGVLYQNGTPANRLAADIVTGDQSKHLVTASGHVRLRSISDPTSSVQCDQVVWHVDTNMMVGTGHVVFKKGGFTQTAPSFSADTKMKVLTMPGPGVSSGKVGATMSRLNL